MTYEVELALKVDYLLIDAQFRVRSLVSVDRNKFRRLRLHLRLHLYFHLSLKPVLN